MATITMTGEEWTAQLDARCAAEERVAQLERELVAAKSADPLGTILKLNVMVRELMTIMRFAIGNLPPETTRRWPWATLDKIATLLPTMPDYTIDDSDLMREIGAFSKEVQGCELQRRTKHEQRVQPVEATPTPRAEHGKEYDGTDYG